MEINKKYKGIDLIQIPNSYFYKQNSNLSRFSTSKLLDSYIGQIIKSQTRIEFLISELANKLGLEKSQTDFMAIISVNKKLSLVRKALNQISIQNDISDRIFNWLSQVEKLSYQRNKIIHSLTLLSLVIQRICCLTNGTKIRILKK